VLTAPTHTPAGPVARWPRSPPYGRFTPAEWTPGWGNARPSTIRTPSSAPRSRSTACPCWGHRRASAHRPALLKDGMARPAWGATPSTARPSGALAWRGSAASNPWR
jgi:hypothetical protein